MIAQSEDIPRGRPASCRRLASAASAVGALVTLVTMVSPVLSWSGEASKKPGPESFVEAFRTHLGPKATACTSTTFLGFWREKRLFQESLRTAKVPPPRDVVCFGYSGDIKTLKEHLKEFLAAHGKADRAKSYGRWRCEEYRVGGEDAQVGRDDWERATLYGKHRCAWSLELEVDRVPAEIVFEEENNTVSFWYVHPRPK